MANGLRKVVRKVKRAILRDESTYYDMFLNRGEQFFGRLYHHEIRKTLQAQGFQPPLRILDAGCQAGRLAIPLALDGHRVTGVDTSAVGLRRLKRHAKESGVTPELIRADLSRWLPRCPDASFDVVVCAEVLYLRKNFRILLQELSRVLRPGGLCFISHRPTGYYLAEAFQHQDWDAVRLLLSFKEGILFGSYYNWQDREDLDQLYRQVGLEPLAITPIGFLSWLAIKPDDLTPEGQELLFKAEQASHQRCPGSGRYLLVCARRS